VFTISVINQLTKLKITFIFYFFIVPWKYFYSQKHATSVFDLGATRMYSPAQHSFLWENCSCIRRSHHESTSRI